MSRSNDSPKPQPTTSNPSTDLPHPSGYESESDESDESEDLSAYRDKAVSPAVSYNSMASEQSMNPPLKFSREPDVTWLYKATFPSPTLASVQSEQSMDPPVSFIYRSKVPKTPSPRTVEEISPGTASVKSEQSTVPTVAFKIRESCTSLMMREHLRCSVCKYMLKEPVSIPCGHSFCKTCIQSYWTQPAHAGSFHCPQCRKRFKTPPALNLNLTLANVVQTQQQAWVSPALLTQTYAVPGDVACDICSGRKIRAVKSCVTCCESYCEAHVREHYTVEVLHKHTLTEPTKDLEQGVYKLGKTNTSSEDVPKDQMSNMMKQMKQLQNKVNKIEEKLEDVEKRTTGAQHPDLVTQLCDFAVPENNLFDYFSD